MTTQSHSDHHPNEERLSPEEERAMGRLMDAMDEIDRVQKLTTPQLVDELLNRMPFTELDELLEEACTRLDPTWHQRAADGPLNEDDKAMIDRAMARFHTKLAEVTANLPALERTP